jgi:hypothetical protein
MRCESKVGRVEMVAHYEACEADLRRPRKASVRAAQAKVSECEGVLDVLP